MKYLDYDFTEVKDHEELFDHEFGVHGKFKVGFGVGKSSVGNPADVQGSFMTPDHQIKDVSYYAGDSMAMGGDRTLVVSDHLDAMPDDEEGIVGFLVYNNGKPNGRLSMFVNDTDVDPEPNKKRDTTHGGAEYLVPRETWLKPNTQYFWRLYRTDVRQDGMHPPLALEAYGK